MSITNSFGKKILLYMLLSYGITWLVWIPWALETQGYLPSNLKFLADMGKFGAWGPLIAAIIVALLYSGFSGLKELFKRTFSKGFPKKWWLVALLLLPLIIGLPLLITMLTGSIYEFPPETSTPFILPIVFIVVLFTTGPLQEEYGWRGTLYEELTKKIKPINAAIATGTAWAFWHLPQFFIKGNGMYYEKPFWGLLVSTILISIIMAWAYNKTNKNLLIVLVMHASFNFAHYIFPILSNDIAGLLYFLLLFVTVAIILRFEGSSLGRK